MELHHTKHVEKTPKTPHFSILEDRKLGQGGFGDVYLCRYQGQDAAVKILSNKWKFLPEAKTLRSLNHPNIIKFYHVQYHKGKIAGKLDAKPRTKERIMAEIVNGVAYLHQNNIIHRDLKSLNVLLGEKYTVKICDFGLATAAKNIQKPGKPLGTLRWMAPELLTDRPDYTKASDIYALGCVFWEIMTGKLPYNDYSDDSPDIIRDKIKRGEHDKVPEQVPQKYAYLIYACRNVDLSARPSMDKIQAIFDGDYEDIEEEDETDINDVQETILSSTCTSTWSYAVMGSMYTLSRK